MISTNSGIKRGNNNSSGSGNTTKEADALGSALQQGLTLEACAVRRACTQGLSEQNHILTRSQNKNPQNQHPSNEL
jgi:hypothetical protein